MKEMLKNNFFCLFFGQVGGQNIFSGVPDIQSVENISSSAAGYMLWKVTKRE
jgi:hypothetical protein